MLSLSRLSSNTISDRASPSTLLVIFKGAPVPRGVPQSLAGFALTSFAISVGVLFRIRMPFRTSFPRRIQGGKAYASKNVRLVRDWLQMVWIYAITNATKVIDYQAFWNLAYAKLVRQSVNASQSTVHTDGSIASACRIASPEPAGPQVWTILRGRPSKVNSQPKTFGWSWPYVTIAPWHRSASYQEIG
jgi:hypothetical protein